MSITRLYIMPTLRCNGTCEYCYIPKSVKHAGESDGHFFRVLEQFIAGAGEPRSPASPQLRFIGGEPYLRPDLLRSLSSRFIEAFPGHLIVINTNATLIGSELIAFWRSQDCRVLHIVSIDGLSVVHDKRRRLASGEGSFDAVLRGIRRLQEGGLHVACNMVLDRESAEGMDSFFGFLAGELCMKELSVSLRSSPGYWEGAGEMFGYLEKAYACSENLGLTLTGHHRLHLGFLIPGLRCRAGENTVLVTPQSRLFACQRFVGRSPGAAYESAKPFEAHLAGLDCADTCYDYESRRLGKMLFGMYSERYPRYTDALDTDRLFFGVLPEEIG